MEGFPKKNEPAMGIRRSRGSQVKTRDEPDAPLPRGGGGGDSMPTDRLPGPPQPAEIAVVATTGNSTNEKTPPPFWHGAIPRDRPDPQAWGPRSPALHRGKRRRSPGFCTVLCWVWGTWILGSRGMAPCQKGGEVLDP